MLAEVGCYSGALLSLLIAWRLFKIESLTFIIKMYLFYFTIDSIFGVLEAIFLFKLKRDRQLNFDIPQVLYFSHYSVRFPVKKSNLAIVFNTYQSGLYGLPKRCFSQWQYRESGGHDKSCDQLVIIPLVFSPQVCVCPLCTWFDQRRNQTPPLDCHYICQERIQNE